MIPYNLYYLERQEANIWFYPYPIIVYVNCSIDNVQYGYQM